MNYDPAPNSTPYPNYGSPVYAPIAPTPEAPAKPERQITPALANLVFFIAVIAFLVLSFVSEAANWSFFLVEITGEGVLAVVAILFCLAGRFNFQKTFSLYKLDIPTVLLCVLAGIAGQFAVRFPAAFNQWVMQIFGQFPTNDLIPTPSDDAGRLLLFLVVAVVAPLCEETLNRGFVLAGYRQMGFGKAILFVGLLFGLFHLYPFRFAYTFLLGMVLAYLVLTTGSIFSSMSAHFGFNLLGALSPWIIDWISKFMNQNSYDLVDNSNTLGFGDVMTTIPISLVGAAFFFLLIRAITKRAARRRPELELGYWGLTRAIHPKGAANAEPQAGPYYGPDRRYVYGRYGFARANLAYQTSFPQNSFGNSYGAPNIGYQWNLPPKVVLSSLARNWWRVSFIPIALFYLFTTYEEIRIRGRYAASEPITNQTAQVQILHQPTEQLVKVISFRDK